MHLGLFGPGETFTRLDRRYRFTWRSREPRRDDRIFVRDICARDQILGPVGPRRGPRESIQTCEFASYFSFLRFENNRKHPRRTHVYLKRSRRNSYVRIGLEASRDKKPGRRFCQGFLARRVLRYLVVRGGSRYAKSSRGGYFCPRWSRNGTKRTVTMPDERSADSSRTVVPRPRW